MHVSRGFELIMLAFLAIFACGCRAHPVSMGIMLIGDAVNDADVKKKATSLKGKAADAADQLFGPRLETFVDADNQNRMLLVYPVRGDVLGRQRYVVELSRGRVVALSKAQEDLDGVEDTIKSAGLKKKLIGKTPAGCRIEGELGHPVASLNSLDTGELVQVYDVRNWSNLRGARYCVLRFDGLAQCQQVKLVGVSASTKDDPARR